MRVLLMSNSGVGLLAVLLLVQTGASRGKKEQEPYAILELGGVGDGACRMAVLASVLRLPPSLMSSKNGSKSKRASRRYLAGAIPSGAPIFSSKSPSPCQRQWSSCSALARNGCTRTEAGRSPLSLRSTLCFSRGPTESSGGLSSQRIATR